MCVFLYLVQCILKEIDETDSQRTFSAKLQTDSLLPLFLLLLLMHFRFCLHMVSSARQVARKVFLFDKTSLPAKQPPSEYIFNNKTRFNHLSKFVLFMYPRPLFYDIKRGNILAKVSAKSSPSLTKVWITVNTYSISYSISSSYNSSVSLLFNNHSNFQVWRKYYSNRHCHPSHPLFYQLHHSRQGFLV